MGLENVILTQSDVTTPDRHETRADADGGGDSQATLANPPTPPSPGDGRIIVVGGDAALNAMLQRLAPQANVQCQGSYLLAMGDIGVKGQPAAVVGRLAAIDDPQATARGLRRLAPAAQIVAISAKKDDQQTQDLLRAGFDEVLSDPVEPAALAHALLLNPASSTSSTSSSSSSTPKTQTPGAEHARAQEASAPKSLIDEQLASQQVFDQLLQSQRQASKPSAQGASAPQTAGLYPIPADLGDVDLVDHLVAKRPGFPDLAMRLLRDRADLGDVAFLPGDESGQQTSPARGLDVGVAYNGHHFGKLHATADSDPVALKSWADWLAPWLALHAQLSGLWDLALKDELTGVWNRRFFYRFLSTILQRASDERFRVTLMVFDIDDFKGYNDRYGHAAGDDILRQAGQLMQSVVRDQDVVARIGGDEFAVIFWDAEGPRRPNSQHPHDVRKAAERFQKVICTHRFPKLLDQAHGTLTISGGLASFPWDGRSPEELVKQADEAALRSKKQGKNALTFGPGAQRACGLGDEASQ